jgi:pimeloyl-ACP methyl ester carboxylesterase
MNSNGAMALTLRGVELRYRDAGAGAGAPVLLLHGWGADSAGFKSLETRLAPHFRVLSLDLPGFGGSAAPSEAWSLRDYVDLVKDFMAELGISSPIVLGHSFGGRIAICLGAQGLASKLILANSAGVRPRRRPLYYARVYAYKLAKRLLNLAPASLRPRLLEKLQRRFGSSDYRNAAPILRQILVKVVNEDLSDLLPAIRVPTLLIWGDRDETTPLEQAKVMERKIPDAGLVVLKGAGHFCFLDKPAEFNLVAEHFLLH